MGEGWYFFLLAFLYRTNFKENSFKIFSPADMPWPDISEWFSLASSSFWDLHKIKLLIWAATKEWKKRRNKKKVKNLFSCTNFIYIPIIKISKIIITRDIRIVWFNLLQTLFQRIQLKERIAWAQILLAKERIAFE